MASIPGYLTNESLTATFERIEKSSHAGVMGVWHIDSGLAGTSVGITVHTHGNEPSGLAVLSHFLNHDTLERRLKRGKVTFVINNLEATRRYVHASSDEERRGARWIDINMNRLPDLEASESDTAYEVSRARELLSIWRTFEAAVDVHSVSNKVDPFIVSIGKLHSQFIRGFPMNAVISNIDRVQHNKPAPAYYGAVGTPVFGIEAGLHDDVEAFYCAITCCERFLANTGVIDAEDSVPHTSFDDYFIEAAVRFPDESYELVKVFRPFEKVDAGQLLARGDGPEIVAPFDGHAVMPPATQRPSKYGPHEEVMFLARPVRHVAV